MSSDDSLDRESLRDLHLLTDKPFIYVFNLDDGDLTDESRRAKLSDLVSPAPAVFVSAKLEAERLGVPYLGEVPLALAIRTSSDAGQPVMVAEPHGPHAAAFRAIAERLLEALDGHRPRPAPRIVIE